MIHRKKLLSLTLLSLVLIFCSSFRPDCNLKFNGIYACKLDDEHSAVIRFYQDGTVLASTSVNDYMDVFSWFKKENKDMVLSGKYKINDCAIKFEVEGVSGEQKYNGSLAGDVYQCVVKDVKSGKSATRTYTFFAL
jgi:hypothetical protein